ncbi:NAD-binding protein [Fomitiporia mediterranea MF3/22]|uniref:NAD-binding protein n=1 Tax=Fomitiporia mediterranea (strain MF3/22) TaxID=694068 RepID=UPI0004409AFE|nr:NAD-binding protein [Fomitiporia mediterranea MF3/22]EJD08585.1 NAD-binding protein [Fomitiporia mediterranea MF3/22]
MTAARNISDQELYTYASKVTGQVVLITGGASGIGRATVIELAKRGAKLVIGDINTKASEELVGVIRYTGGTAIWKACDVLEYDDLRSLFEYALEEYGSVDIVIANAGIAESEQLVGDGVQLDEHGRPVKGKLKTIDMNLTSVIYTAQLAYHYFGKATNEKSLKTLIMTASILSFTSPDLAPLYCSSKHGVLAFSLSLRPEFEANGFRIATVHPWFVDTPLVPGFVKRLMHGIPLSPVHRVAGAIVLAATDEEADTNGAAYCIPDERDAFRIPYPEVNDGVYTKLSERAKNTIP